MLLHTKEQVAALLQISPRTLYQMVREGAVTYLKHKRLVRFRLADVTRQLNQMALRPALDEEHTILAG